MKVFVVKWDEVIYGVFSSIEKARAARHQEVLGTSLVDDDLSIVEYEIDGEHHA